MTFVGEIGTPRREYLYDLQYVDLLLIRRGYERRQRPLWSANRWQTYYLMAAQVGSDGMRKSGINSPTDLIKFPWERTATDMPSDDEVADMIAEMKAMNGSRLAVHPQGNPGQK